MQTLEAIALGLIQGIAEFLPISSSGHLTLAADAFGVNEPPVLLNLCLHMATLVVIVLFYRRRLLSIFFPLNKAYILAIVAASIPTGIIGILLKTLGESLFTADVAAGLLIINGLFLLLLYRSGKMAHKEEDSTNMSPPSLGQAFCIGVVQGIAALPGISRSGSTIGVSRLMGLPGALAAEFSLLASVPAIAGAALLESRHLDTLHQPGLVLLGTLMAGVSGWFAVKWLLLIVRKNAWGIWGGYCIGVGLLYGIWRYV